MSETIEVDGAQQEQETAALFPQLTLENMLEAGVHFGHQNHRWNPKMNRYIFGERNGIHIMDLTQTLTLMDKALRAIQETVRRTGRILFVGTKLQASPIVAAAAKRCAQYYVNHRWLGGTLTNWKTIAASIQRLRKLEELIDTGMRGFTKKEQSRVMNAYQKLVQALGGIKDMGGLPDMLFVIDVNKDFIAIEEAKKLNIPIVAVLDSNSDPDGIRYPIPGNDDATRAIGFYCDLVAEAALDGLSKSLMVAPPASNKGDRERDASPRRSSGRGGGAQNEAGKGAVTADTFKKGKREKNDAASPRDEKSDKGERAKKPKESESDMKKDIREAEISAQVVKELRERTGVGFMDCKKALTQTGGDMEAAIDFLRKRGLAKAAEKAGRAASQGLVAVTLAYPEAAMIEVNCETDFVARTDTFQELTQDLLDEALKHGGDVEATLGASLRGGSGREVIAHAIAATGENITLRRGAYFKANADEIIGSYVHNRVVPGKGEIGALVLLATSQPGDAAQDLANKIAMHVAACPVQAVTPEEIDPDIVAREKAIFEEQSRTSGKPEEVVQKMVEGKLTKFYAEVVLLSQNFVLDQEKTVAQVVAAFEKEHGATVTVKKFAKFKLGEGQ